MIGSSDFTQIGSIEVGKGDWAGLSNALEKSGVASTEVSELRTALDQDSAEEPNPGMLF